MRIQAKRLLAFCMLSLAAAPLLAVKAEVSHRISGCDWFLAEASSGFILMEWYGGNDPDKGESLVGELHSYGMKTVFNLDADAEVRVWIDDFMLSKDDALEQLYEKCE